ncbi:MAG: hypothetical protein JNL74_17360 [Fibrobacteres bacterium]|nr:hypothetical protein [Fibrobacterota bacterium]
MKKFLVAFISTALLLTTTNCKDEGGGITPPVETKRYLSKGTKHFPGEKVWIKCTGNVAASNATVSMTFNTEGDPDWYPLTVIERGSDEISFNIKNNRSYSITTFAKFVLSNGTATDTINDIKIQRIIITYPSENDTFKVRTPITIKWRYYNDFDALNVALSPDEGTSWNFLTGNLNPAIDGSSFKWTVLDTAITAPIICHLMVTKYSDNDGSDIIPIVIKP